MKKLIVLCFLLIPLSAFAWESFMDKCIQSWVGYSLDSVIKKWGYPNYERSIAGKKLYVWETIDYDSDVIEGTGITISATDKKGRETSFTAGGQLKMEFCRKTLEIDDNNKVVNGQWEGNDCPKFYLIGKKYINPANNEWENKKISK